MKRKIITTADGSSTIQIEEWNEQYHSVHGAIQEANHVYIEHGLLFRFQQNSKNLNVELDHFGKPLSDIAEIEMDAQADTKHSASKLKTIKVLEIGFGTGLNAILTFLKAQEINQPIDYVGVEAFPVSSEELAQLNYSERLNIDARLFDKFHDSSWEDLHFISERFTLQKQQKYFKDISVKETFDVIYFDAFGPRVQSELWTEDVFKIMFNALKNNGVLTTYSAKGSVRRAMQTVGFEVERLPGPPGKREMLRGNKI